MEETERTEHESETVKPDGTVERESESSERNVGSSDESPDSDDDGDN